MCRMCRVMLPHCASGEVTLDVSDHRSADSFGSPAAPWLRRIGNLYGISNIAQLVSEIDSDIVASDLDREIADAAARMLAARSTVALDRLRQMSLSGWVPWLLDSTDPAGCDFDTYVHQLFDTYVHQLSVLIPRNFRTVIVRAALRPNRDGCRGSPTPPTPGYARSASVPATRMPSSV